MTNGALALAATLAAALPPKQLGHVPTLDLHADGTMSSVRLLTVGHARPQTPGNASAAPDGLTFLFLVLRKPRAHGLFTLTELRDFQLDGAKVGWGNETEPFSFELDLSKVPPRP